MNLILGVMKHSMVETFVMKISQVLYFLTFLLCSVGTDDMNTFQASDVEDWDRIGKAMASMDIVTVPNNVPRTKGGESSCVEISKENLPFSKKNVPN